MGIVRIAKSLIGLDDDTGPSRKRKWIISSIVSIAVVTTAIAVPVALTRPDKQNPDDTIPDFTASVTSERTSWNFPEDYEEIQIHCSTDLPSDKAAKFDIQWTLTTDIPFDKESNDTFTISHGLQDGEYQLDFLCNVSYKGKSNTASCSQPLVISKHFDPHGSDWEGYDSGTVDVKQNGDGKTITILNGQDLKAYNLVIPSEVWIDDKSYTITAIDSNTFDHDYDLSGSLTIPETVETIGSNAFDNCHNLTSVNIPEGVTTIGNHAFDYCFGLGASQESIPLVIPGSVQTIGEYAFRGCMAIKELILTDGVGSIGNHAFYECFSLGDPNIPLVIPGSVDTIGDYAFGSCELLTSLTISNGVRIIGNHAFNHCSTLSGLLTIPGSVQTVGNGAFVFCGGLDSLIISEGVKTIGDTAFGACGGIFSIQFWPPTINSCTLKPNSFSGVGNNDTSVDKYIDVLESGGFNIEWFITNGALPSNSHWQIRSN